MSAAANTASFKPKPLDNARYLAHLGVEIRESEHDVGNFERHQLAIALGHLGAGTSRPVSALKAAAEGISHAWRANWQETRDEAWICAAVFELVRCACDDFGMKVNHIGPAAADRPAPPAVARWLATWGPVLAAAADGAGQDLDCTALDQVAALLEADPPKVPEALKCAEGFEVEAWAEGYTQPRATGWLSSAIVLLLRCGLSTAKAGT